MENRNGLIVDAMATHADGKAEREAASRCWRRCSGGASRRRRTVGADKGYDTRDLSRCASWA